MIHTIWGDVGFGAYNSLIWQLLADDKSRVLFIQFMARRAEAIDRFLQFKQQIEAEKVPLRVAWFVTDSDSTYTSAEAQRKLADHGVQHRTYGPHRKESVIERAMQTKSALTPPRP